MSVIAALRRIAVHEERVARMELVRAEQAREKQEQVVAQATQAIDGALALGSQGPVDAHDHYYRHGYALRMEMTRRGAQQRLIEHDKAVGSRREAMSTASRSRGTLDRLVEQQEAAEATERQRTEQKHLDETGLQGWWRRN
ncbi:MAG: flagellar FliJ family protein [Myxococcota bacterium]